MFKKIIISVVSASMAVMPVAAHAAPAAASANPVASSPAVASMFDVAAAGLCMGAPAGCVLPLEKPAPQPTRPTVVIPPKVQPPLPPVEEASGKGFGSILIGVLGAAALVGVALAVFGNDDDDPASP